MKLNVGALIAASLQHRLLKLTFAGSDVVEVQLVALLGSLQGALGGEEVAGGVVGLVVGAANLQGSKQQMSSQQKDKRGSVVVQIVLKLTCSNSPSAAGQLEGSWHTHMGLLLSSTSHTLPFLQGWFRQGSVRINQAMFLRQNGATTQNVCSVVPKGNRNKIIYL